MPREVGRVTDSPKRLIIACNVSDNRGVTPVEGGRKVQIIFSRRIAKQRALVIAINRIRSLVCQAYEDFWSTKCVGVTDDPKAIYKTS